MSFCFPVPLGSIHELPAETCKEIKASEGGQAVSGKYWFDSIIPGETVFANCDMEKEGTVFFQLKAPGVHFKLGIVDPGIIWHPKL